MIGQNLITVHRVAGALLVLSFVMVMVGALMFVGRNGTSGGAAPSFAYLVWERSFIMAAAVLVALGFIFLQAGLHDVGVRALVLARIAAGIYVIAAVVIVSAESIGLVQAEPPDALIVVYVILAFLAQAVLGAVLVSTALFPAWIGWVAIVWNVGWLGVLLFINPGDIYFPVLHHAVPLLIGIPLLWRGQEL